MILRAFAALLGVVVSAAAVAQAPAKSSAADVARAAQSATARKLNLANKPFTGDFDAMLKRRIIRVDAPYSRSLFYLDKGRAFLTKGGVFTDAYIDAYIELKMQEVTRFRMTTHPVEFDMYYSL